MAEWQGQTGGQAAAPRGVRLALVAGVTLLAAGAITLLSGRGDALLIDLSAGMARIFCF